MQMKTIPGFEMYCADESGMIFSKSFHQTGLMKPLKPVRNRKGYERVSIYRKLKFVHRLIAKTFLPDYSEELQVNHRNGIKNDNRLCNLEMATQSENMKHRSAVLGFTQPTTGKRCPDSVRGKISKANCGKRRSAEAIANMSKAHGVSDEKKNAILRFMRENPSASQRQIASCFHVSQAFIWKIRQEKGAATRIEIQEITKGISDER